MEATDTKAIGSVQDFQLAVNEAHLTGIDHLVVTDKLFKTLTKGTQTNYLTWGDPGIKVFKEGTMAGILEEEQMDAEAHRNMIIKATKKK